MALTPCQLRALFHFAHRNLQSSRYPEDLKPVLHCDEMTTMVHQVTASAIVQFAEGISQNEPEENISEFTNLVVEMFMAGIVAGFVLRDGLAIGRGEVSVPKGQQGEVH